MGHREVVAGIFREWRGKFVDPNTFEQTWRNLMALDAKSLSLRATMILKYELEGSEP